MTLALALYLFQNDSGLRGNNGLSGLQNLPGLDAPQSHDLDLVLLGLGAGAGAGLSAAAWIVSGKFGSVIRGIRDNEARVRFLGYSVESYKLFIFTLTACIAGIAGALYYPQAGIINPAEIAPIASIYLAVWVAIGGRGRLYGAVIGAASSAWSQLVHRRQAPTFRWVLHHQMGRLVADRAWACPSCGHAVRAQGHRRAGRSVDRAPQPDRHGADLGPDQARCANRRPRNEHASGSFRRFRQLRRVPAINNLSFQIGDARCARSSGRTARARPPSWTSSPARPGPTRAV